MSATAPTPGIPLREWRVLGLELGVGEPESVLRERAAAAIGAPPEALRGLRIAHKAVDARRFAGRRAPRFSVHVDVALDADFRPPGLARALRAGRAGEPPARGRLEVDAVHPSLRGARVAVLGAGPGGLFAALVLARNGVAADLVDRGSALGARGRALARFDRSRRPDPECNLLFGEGGAGTYSDGKLHTRVTSPLEIPLLEELVRCGAPPEILYDARAHVGTDGLHRLLPRLREGLEREGVRFHFDVRVEGLVASAGAPRRVRALRTAAGELACAAAILAPGHSARDTLRALARQGVVAEAKPFQLGVRIEHPQALIDAGRYGTGPEARALGPAYYGLVHRGRDGAPGAFSFCMCPGGRIVASVHTPGALCTNGMSNSLHSSGWANAALVTTLGPREIGPGAFAGVALQEALERRFFEAGGGDFTAPAQRAPDFLAGRDSREPGPSSYRLGTCSARIDLLLPERVRDALRAALHHFERRIPGFAGPDGLLVGIESRSSGPLRLPRDPAGRALGFANLLPVGEGAGYAGGIMSAAIDGARAAQLLLRHGV